MAGSDFSEATKEQARRLAFFRCCYCHERPGDDVHHLIPKEEGGSAEVGNAILLCVQCHGDYGHRPEKRAQLRQARDHWYEIVERRYAPVALHQVEEFNALRNDVHQMSNQLRFLTETIIGRFEAGSTGASDVVNIASTMISSLTSSPDYTMDGVDRSQTPLALRALVQDDDLSGHLQSTPKIPK